MSSPGSWMETTSALRDLEHGLVELWAGRGYREVMPSLLLPRESAEAAAPAALAQRTFDVSVDGAGRWAVRSDHTSSVAWLASRRLQRIDEPVRLSYRGTVLRKPGGERQSDVEALQAGCERISAHRGPEGDEEVARLAAETLLLLRIDGALLELGHWGIVGPLLDAIEWPAAARVDLETAINRKSLPALDELGERHGRSPAWRLLRRLVHLGGSGEEVEPIAAELRELGVEEAWRALRELGEKLGREFPGLRLRLEPTDIRHFSYYTGLTMKAFAPRHGYALLSGGRYDAVYPALGRPFGACGFGVNLGRVIEERGR